MVSIPLSCDPPSVPTAYSTADPTADRELDSRRSASLRRIAIVLQDLPASLASQLMASLDEPSRQRLRIEASRLKNIDPIERQRALESFTGSLRRSVRRDHPSSSSTGGIEDEFVVSHQAASNYSRDSLESMPSPASPSEAVPPSTDQLSRVIENVRDDDLLALLKQERAQTVAVVLSKIPPRRAANLIPKMSLTQRQDVLTRIGRLQSVPDDMMDDLASAFAGRVSELSGERQTQQLRELLGPLSAAWSDDDASMTSSVNVAEHIPAKALAASPSLQAILNEMQPSATAHQDALAAETNTPVQSNGHPATAHDFDPETRLRQATGAGIAANASSIPVSEASPKSERSTDEIHRELVKMPAKLLCETLGRVDTRTAMLALCGLPNETAEAVMACLPRSQANQVRRQLAGIGSLELRDIDNAKQTVADAALTGGSVARVSKVAGSNAGAADPMTRRSVAA